MGTRHAAVVVALSLIGCGAQQATYKKAVDAYTATLPERGAVYYPLVSAELRKELVLSDASLVCVVDKDHGKKDTAACACANGLPDDWEANCKAWMEPVTAP